MYMPRWEFKHGASMRGYLGGGAGGGGGGDGWGGGNTGGDNAGGYGDGFGGDSYGGGTAGAGDGSGGYGWGDQPGDYDMPSNDQTPGWASNDFASDWNMSFADPAGDMSQADFNSQFGDYNAAHTGQYGSDTFGNDSDVLTRLKQFVQKYAMNKAVTNIAQTNPVLGSIMGIVGPVAQNQMSTNPNQQTPVGQQIAGNMVNAMMGPLGAIPGIANLFGANIPSPGAAIANANVDYKGLPEGQSGFGTSTTGQSGTGGNMFDSILNGAATAGGLYSMFQNYRGNNNMASQLNGMFSQNSPYAEQLRQQLSRRDAAAGRRSQYGPREVELQAKLAAMANQISPNIMAARQMGNQNLMQMLGMLTSANKMGVFDPMKGWFGNMFGGSSGGYVPTSNDLAGQYTGDSYGDWGGPYGG